MIYYRKPEWLSVYYYLLYSIRPERFDKFLISLNVYKVALSTNSDLSNRIKVL